MFRLRPALNSTPATGVVSEGPPAKSIPRLLHQTYRSRELPAELANNVSRLTALNPGWQHCFYTDSDIVTFLAEHYGKRVLDYYTRIESRYGAARADLFRYLLMYKFGGVYLDIKSTLTKPLDAVLGPDDSYVLSQWSDRYPGSGRHPGLENIPGGEFQQWHIVASPGHPYLKAVIDNVLQNIDYYNPCWHGVGKWGVINLTGPIAYTLAIHPILHLHSHRVADFEHDLGFTYTVFDKPESWSNNSHKAMFRWHYSDLHSSIVKLGISKAILVVAIKAIRGPWRLMKKCLASFSKYS